MLRVPSPVPGDVEKIVSDMIGCLIAVHRELGPGLPEPAYAKATCVELAAEGLPFESEKRLPVFYRGKLLCDYYADLLVGGQVIVELKAVESLAPVHHAQLLSYMRLAHVRVGLLVNFNVPILKDGIKRKVI